MKAKDYKDLNVWKKGIEIVDIIYDLTERFPRTELFGLALQMRKAAVSIPSNIAEGFGKQYKKEYSRFLRIALGSCAELDTQVVISRRRAYITEDEFKQVEDMINHESRMLMNLLKRVEEGH
ncbi:MAG: hypothetical protein DRP66_11260 [Planctomycetota bacterium]|nr:MAG: hypothetical protein DRP66_11260 [Planctomycetota bacterium]